MDEPLSATAQSTSQLKDVSLLTDIIASSSKVPLEQLIKPTSQTYLSNLTTLALPELLAEPTALQTQSHHLTSSLTSLTHTSYPTFLSLHETTNALTTSLASLSSSLDSLLKESLPALEGCAAGWKDKTGGVLKERGKARLVLEQHEKIRDLLDIPILIDTCVRNGYFAEALSLVSHAKLIAANASAANKQPPMLLSSVLAEIHNSIIQMLLSLLTTLYEPNRKLPALYKAVNFLRKMDVFGPGSPFASGASKAPQLAAGEKIGDSITSEEQIALAFLVGRETCLKTTLEPPGKDVLRMAQSEGLDEREKEDLARYLKKYIDLWREGVYDIITQFTTIFLEKTSPAAQALLASQKAGEIRPPSSPSTLTPPLQEWTKLRSLITTYASRALSAHLLPILSPTLRCLSLTFLPSLLTQLTYCSTAFARVGLDFRTTLSTLFSSTVAEVVSNDMRHARNKFTARFQIPTSTNTSSTRTLSRLPKWDQPSKWLLGSVQSASSPNPHTFPSPPVPVTPATPLSASPFLSQGPAHIPPQILASYPPVAEYTNALLGVLNGLRLLAPMSIINTLVKLLDDEILFASGERVIAYIKAYCQEHAVQPLLNGHGGGDGRSDEEKEKEHQRRVVLAFGQVFFKIFVPFMRRALVEGVYSIRLNASFKGEGDLLPGIVMDWEDFALENEEEGSESGSDESEDESDNEDGEDSST